MPNEATHQVTRVVRQSSHYSDAQMAARVSAVFDRPPSGPECPYDQYIHAADQLALLVHSVLCPEGSREPFPNLNLHFLGDNLSRQEAAEMLVNGGIGLKGELANSVQITIQYYIKRDGHCYIKNDRNRFGKLVDMLDQQSQLSSADTEKFRNQKAAVLYKGKDGSVDNEHAVEALWRLGDQIEDFVTYNNKVISAETQKQITKNLKLYRDNLLQITTLVGEVRNHLEQPKGKGTSKITPAF